MRFRSVGQREFPADQEFQLALFHQPERFLNSAAHDFRYRSGGIEREAAHLRRLIEQPKQVKRFGWTTGASVEDYVSERCQASETLRKGCRPDRIENQVRATSAGQA